MHLLAVLLVMMASVSVAHFVHALSVISAVAVLAVSLPLLLHGFWHHQRALWLWLALSCYGWASYVINDLAIVAQPLTCSAVVELVDFPKPASPRGETVRVKILHAGDCPVKANATMILRAYDSPNWRLNDRYQVGVKLLPSNRRYLGTQRVDAYASLVAIIDQLPSSPHTIRAWRLRLSTLIDKHYSANSKRWWQALLIGNRVELDDRDWQMLRRSGTSHLLAISGLHLAIVASMSFWFIQILCAHSRVLSRRIEPRSLALIGALIIGLMYSLISGAQPPVMRAWIMFAVFTLHWFYAPLRSGIQALLLTAIILILYDVYLLFSVSAWLSFYATAVVILSYRRFKHLQRLQLWVSIQAVITIALWPLVWALFGGISVAGYMVNIIVVPWLGAILMAGYLGLIFPQIVVSVEAVFRWYMNTIAFFAQLDWGYLQINWQPTLLSAFFVCLAVLLWLSRRNMRQPFRSKRLPLYIVIICLISAGGATMVTIYPRNEYKILQQDPLLAVVTHEKHTYLINAGYRGHHGDQAQTLLLPYLRQHGLIPEAVIVTDTSKRATTALTTLVKHYPDLELYSIVVAKNVALNIKYCPSETPSPLTFDKGRHCQADIAGKWQIKP